jgi:hypothetical protein
MVRLPEVEEVAKELADPAASAFRFARLPLPAIA